MTEIKRYDVNKANMIGLVRFDEKESGRWVKYEDLSALQEQLSSYSMSAGQTDQRKAESDAVRVALGLSADADDVAPCDLVDAIAALLEQVRALAAERDGSLKAIADIYMAVIGGRPGWSNWHAYLDDIVEEVSTALHEIRDQAVNGFSEFCGDNSVFIKETCNYDSLADAACIYLARIREGEQP